MYESFEFQENLQKKTFLKTDCFRFVPSVSHYNKKSNHADLETDRQCKLNDYQ